MSLQAWRHRWSNVRRELAAIALACRHPATPWYARALAAGVVAYALSPIDLIPDPIPVLGHLDDLVLLPLGVLLVRRLIPPEVLAECRERVADAAPRTSGRWIAAVLVVACWGVALWLCVWVLLAMFAAGR
jgi:uncharacterized membrane protein YkvA (DUF1232 family)